jgi:hypothetical protein
MFIESSAWRGYSSRRGYCISTVELVFAKCHVDGSSVTFVRMLDIAFCLLSVLRKFSLAYASIIGRREIPALEAVNLCAPTDATEVVDTVGNGKVLVHIHVAFAVVVAVLRSANASPQPHSKAADSLVESTVPVVVALQYGRDIMSAYEDALHAPIDACVALVSDCP